MKRANAVKAAGHWDHAGAIDSIVLAAHDRHRRRVVLTGERGTTFLLDLPQAIALRDGDGKLVGVLEKAQALEWAGSDVPAETQLRLVAEQMPALLWTADRESRITSNWGAGQPWSRNSARLADGTERVRVLGLRGPTRTSGNTAL